MNNNHLSVEVSGLTVKFGDFTAVDNISFSVNKGEIFGFLGANGAGKTTTIRVLCGLLIPTSGNVKIAGYTFDHGMKMIKSKVGYMSQRFTLYNDLTVKENLSFTASLRNMDDKIFNRRKDELFEFIGFDFREDSLVGNLPGGLRQKVSLVAAMLHDPEIIFLDEPTAGVPPNVRAKFWDLIRELSNTGKTVFVTTHYMDEAEECHRIALMKTGQIIALDSPDGLENSFPEILIEIEPEENAPKNWIEELKKQSGIRKIEPYGLRCHLTVENMDIWNRISGQLDKKLKAKLIRPSLEDVFIRLVEGEDK